jgi:hypothetical protein
LESHEVHPGMTVRVREDRRKPELEGRLGIAKKRYGTPEYPALDVRLEDGQAELFWFHQLDHADVDLPTRSVPFYDGS